MRLIQGDFNLHCSYWDPEVEHDDPLRWTLISHLTAIGLSLVNDDGEHTFFQGADHPQVLNLLWLHEDTSLLLTVDICFNITRLLSDHRELSLQCCDHFTNTLGVPNLSICFLPTGSDEELDLVLFVLNATDKWSSSSVNARASTLIHIFFDCMG